MSGRNSNSQMMGVVSAIVKKNKDTSGQGRVLVEFRWMEGTQQKQWAPVATLMSGKGRGSWFMPEEEDEVLVAFEQGDISHPYVIGYLWNGVDQPPETEPKNRVILTPGGHTLRFEDTDNQKKIVIRTAGNHEVRLDDTQNQQQVDIRTAGKHEVRLDDTGKQLQIQTSGGLKITLDDNGQSITLEGGGRKLTMSNGTVQIT